MYYIAQIFGALAWIFLLISYWKSGSKKLLYFQLIACIFFAANYSILGAKTGIIIVIFEIIRDFLYIKVKKPIKIFYITIPFYILIAIFTGKNLPSLFSVFASLIDSYALTKKNNKVVMLGIVTYSLWIVYDLYYKNYITIIAEIFLIISNLIVLFKYKKTYYKSDKLSFSRGIINNSKILDELYKLNSDNLDCDFTWPMEGPDDIISNRKIDFVIIHDEHNIIGYINFVIIDEKEYEKLLNMNRYIGTKRKNMVLFNKKGPNYISINKIIVKNDYRNERIVKLISDKVFDYVNVKKNRGFRIDGIIAISTNEFEKSIFEFSNFYKEKETNTFSIYILK